MKNPDQKTKRENGMNAPAHRRRCYTVEEVREILGISRNSVYALIRKNEFRTIQIGRGSYRIVCSSFDEWLCGR